MDAIFGREFPRFARGLKKSVKKSKVHLDDPRTKWHRLRHDPLFYHFIPPFGNPPADIDSAVPMRHSIMAGSFLNGLQGF